MNFRVLGVVFNFPLVRSVQIVVGITDDRDVEDGGADAELEDHKVRLPQSSRRLEVRLRYCFVPESCKSFLGFLEDTVVAQDPCSVRSWTHIEDMAQTFNDPFTAGVTRFIS